jgi:hypothetical protein
MVDVPLIMGMKPLVRDLGPKRYISLRGAIWDGHSADELEAARANTPRGALREETCDDYHLVVIFRNAFGSDAAMSPLAFADRKSRGTR